jgi:outer membrane protein assembly factor BamB
MLKRIALAAVLLIVAAALIFRFTGLRFAVDGSGMMPRFWSRAPNYDALEADRARQREQPPPAAVETAAPRPTPPSEAAPPPTAVEAAVRPEPKATARSLKGFWPDFRGPNRDGRYDDGAIRTEWPEGGLPLLWKQPIGAGYASFVVADGRAFTIEQRRRQEIVSAYDINNGRELWTHGWDANFEEAMGGDGPRATPTYHDGRIFALGAEGELRCLDARTGGLIWRRNILTDNGAANLQWGMSASPLIVDDKVIVLPGGPGGKSVAAYRKTTGEPAWTALDDQQAYTSPMLVTLDGVRQIVVVSASRVLGLDVEQGRLLWEYPWTNYNGISVAQPIFLGNNRVFMSAGYGKGAAVFELTRSGERFTTRTIWENTRMKNKFTSSVLRDGFIYGLDEAILACVDAATGELKWKGGRYGYGQVMLAGDWLIVLTESGDVALVKATPERHEEVAKFAAIDGKTWNHPVIADGHLLVRNLKEMAAFDIRPR